MRSRWLPLLWFVLALAIRLAFVADVDGEPTFRSPLVDALAYDRAARVVAEHGPGALELPYYQPPLYPMLLGGLYVVVGAGPGPAHVAQAILGALTVALLYLLVARAGGRAAGSVAAGLLALYGPVLAFESQLLPPTLLLLLLTTATLCLLRADAAPRGLAWRIAGGLALGIAGAARPSLLLLALPAAVWWGRGGTGRWASAAGLLAVILLPVLPFAVANRIGGGETVLVSWNGGINFYLGNGANSDSLTAIQPGHAWDTLQVAPLRAGVRTRAEESRYWRDRGLREAAADPGAWAGALLRKTVRLLDARETPRNTDYRDLRRDSSLLSLPLPGFVLVAPLALLGWLIAFGPGRAPPRLRSWLTWILAAIAAENLLFFVAGRYRVEAVPTLCALAGLGVAHAIRARGRVPVPAAILVVLFAAFSAVDWLGERDVDETRAGINRALAWKRAGLEAGSERILRETVARDPHDPDLRQLLGEAEMRAGRPEEALAHFRTALESAPEAHRTLLQAAQAADLLDRREEAEALWRRAVEADPFSVDARLGYGTHLALRERWDDARFQFQEGLRLDPGDARLRRNLGNLERHQRGS